MEVLRCWWKTPLTNISDISNVPQFMGDTCTSGSLINISRGRHKGIRSFISHSPGLSQQSGYACYVCLRRERIRQDEGDINIHLFNHDLIDRHGDSLQFVTTTQLHSKGNIPNSSIQNITNLLDLNKQYESIWSSLILRDISEKKKGQLRRFCTEKAYSDDMKKKEEERERATWCFKLKFSLEIRILDIYTLDFNFKLHTNTTPQTYETCYTILTH